jgi:hypothetical protein
VTPDVLRQMEAARPVYTVLRRSLCVHSAKPLPPEGVHFDLANVRRMPLGQTSITRTLHGLIEAGMISKSPIKGKYRLTDEFVDSLKSEMTEGMPRGIFIHFPDLRVFDISGIEEWTEEELDRYTRRLKERWTIRTKQAGRVEAAP